MSIKPATEAEIQRAVIACLELRGAVVVRVNSGMLPTAGGGRVRFNRTSAGSCADILACYRGRFLALEVKRPGGKLTDGQSVFLNAVLKAGGLGCIVRSVADCEGVLLALDQHDAPRDGATS